MRVGLLIYGSLDTLSGGYLYDRKLVQHLRDAGDEVEIISIPWRNYAAHLADNFSASLLRHLLALRVDVLVQDELNHPSLFWLNQKLRVRVPSPFGRGRRVRADASYPIVSIVHHLRSSELRPAWQNALYHIPEKAYLRSMDGFVFNSQTTRGVVENAIGETRPHVVAYPAGNRLNPQISDEEIVARAQEETFKIAFLGSVISRKNLHTLLDALALVEEDWQLTIIGNLDVEPAYVAKIRQQIARLGLDEKINFAGALNDEPLKAKLRENHVLAMPSSYEGFGIAYLEGMGYGLPAIASTDGAAHEIITSEVDGYLIHPSDVKNLASYLRTLARDRKKLIQMNLAARKRYHAHPTWDESMANIRKFLLKMIDVG